MRLRTGRGGTDASGKLIRQNPLRGPRTGPAGPSRAAHQALKPHTQAYLREVATAAGKAHILRLTLDMVRDMTAGIPHRLEHPMLICHGDHEAGFIRRHAGAWHEAQPGSSLTVIEDAHHIANQDNPRGFNEKLIAFLDSVA